MQSITTLISVEEGLRRARVALDATLAESPDATLTREGLDAHFRRAFSEAPQPSGRAFWMDGDEDGWREGIDR